MSNIESDARLYESSQKLQQAPVVEADSILSARIGIHWQGQNCDFHDWSFLPSINMGCDYLPAPIKSCLAGLTRGDEVHHRFSAGELLKSQPSLRYKNIPETWFQPTGRGSTPLRPVAGRYYPSDFFKNISGIYEGNHRPCRITRLQGDTLSVDFNHPLAGKSVEMIVRIESIKKADAERSGRCNDIVALCCDHGPGMQDSLPDQATDFWSGTPFSRQDPSSDSAFFSTPSLQPFWDRTALAELTRLYNRLIPQHARVLDLMAGIHSPLQESDITPSAVFCAGLNGEELAHNPLCSQAQILDVNTISALPFEGAQFDVVLVHAAIEYAINPQLLMAEIQRVLKPGGRVIISFSNRSIGVKTIQLWSNAHQFERPAIVLTYLHSCPGFRGFNSYSMRGLLHREDDRLVDSDSVYAVWADRA